MAYTLPANSVYSTLFNVIINQMTFADNIAKVDSKLVELCKQSVGMYGDRKIYISTDVLPVHDFDNSQESARKLLDYDKPKDPIIQTIIVDVFKQIRLTTEQYLAKQAWLNSGAFSEFQSVILGWIADSKKIYDTTLINTFIGTHTADLKQVKSVDLAFDPKTTADTEAVNRLTAQRITVAIEDLLDEMEEPNRDYNENGQLRSVSRDDLVVVYNSKYANQITKIDLPTIFHMDAAKPKDISFKLNAKYFGTELDAGGTVAAGDKIRALKSQFFGDKFYYAGDLLDVDTEYAAGEAYREDDNIIAKIIHKNSVPYLSGFEVSYDFFNPRVLKENHYLTFAHSTLTNLKNYPFVVLKANV